MESLKSTLYKYCLDYVLERITRLKTEIKKTQSSANEETKSSAGDKYETGREMMQQETNRNLAQLNEANKLMVALNLVGFKSTSAKIETGSVVKTNNGDFYVAISAGTLQLEGKSYFAISPASPIGLKLKGLQAGDSFILHGKNYQILGVE